MPLATLNRTINQVIITQGGAGSLDLVAAPGAGLRVYVVAIVVTLSAGGTLKFTEGTGPTDLTGTMNIAANGGLVISGDAASPILHTNTANAKLSLVSATGVAQGYIRYFIDA